MDHLTTVWESYERNGDHCAAFLTKELAESHDLYEVGFVTECKIYLSEEGIKELNQGKAVW